MKRRILTTLCLTSLCAAMTACTATANDAPMATNNPTMMNATTAPSTAMEGFVDELLPNATNNMGNGLTSPMISEDPEATGVTTVSTARRAIEQIEDELERLSEVKDAEVILAGNNAAVALEFDEQYKGGVDDRLREIVQERINGVISGVTNVVVTADEALMDQIETLGERLEAASDIADIQNELNAIINKISAS